MNDIKNKYWFEKEWFLQLLWVGGIAALFKLSLLKYELYEAFFKPEQKSDLLWVININFILGLGVLGSLLYSYLTITEIITKKSTSQPIWGLYISITCIVAYFLRFKIQFDIISEHIYQDNSFIVMEIAITVVSLIMASMISLVILMVVLQLLFLEEEEKENKDKETTLPTNKRINFSLEEGFTEFASLKEKLMLLHTYKDGISENEMNRILDDFKELYGRYITLPSPQKEVAYEQIVKAVHYQDSEIQKRIDAIHNTQLGRIERKVKRIMEQS